MTSSKKLQVILLSGVLCLITDPFMVVLQASGQSRYDQSSVDDITAEKQFEFEAVSIHLNKPGSDPLTRQFTPDGYRSSMTLLSMIMLAYCPQTLSYSSWSKIQNAPSWIDDMFDIKARVAQEDMAAWQQAQRNDQIFKDDRLERSALRAILKDRFKLVLHVTPIEVPYLNLMVGKHGSKLKDTVPGVVKPIKFKTSTLGKGFFIEDNGERRFVGVSMKELTSLLTNLSRDYPVQDKTGLIGRYDFTLPWYDNQHDPDSEISNRMPISGIGLELKRGKGPAFNFEIEHIEKPDEN